MTESGAETQVWSICIRLLHWLTVVVLAAQITIAFALMGEPGMATMRWLPLHMSVGVSILGIVMIRLVWRVFERSPARPLRPAIRRLGFLVHVSLYTLILAIVITGWFAYSPMPLMRPVRLFGALPTPTAPRPEGVSTRDFARIHLSLVWAFLAVVSIHVAAALLHASLFCDGLLKGMLFSRSASASNQRGPHRR